MKTPVKIVKKIVKIIGWLALLVRLFTAIKDVLNGDNPGKTEIKNNHKP